MSVEESVEELESIAIEAVIAAANFRCSKAARS